MYRPLTLLAAFAAGCGLGAGDVEDRAPAAVEALRQPKGPGRDLCLPPRTLVCHALSGDMWPTALCVAPRQLQRHLQHGDTPGDCPEVGLPPAEDGAVTTWTPEVPRAPSQLESAPTPWVPQVPKAPAQLCAERTFACQADADCCAALECSWGVCLEKLP